jgi:preprotein translocase subunit SecD
MRAKNRAWLTAVIIIVVVAFWAVFRTPRIMPKEDYAHVYYSYSFEKPVTTESERTRKQIFKEIETELGKEEVFGVKVTVPTKNELKVRADLKRPDDIGPTQDKVTDALEKVLRGKDGKPRFGAMTPGLVTDEFPPKPIARLGRLALYSLEPQVKRGLDLQGGTHLVLQVREQNTLLEYQLAPSPEAVASVLKAAAPSAAAATSSDKAAPDAKEAADASETSAEKPAKETTETEGKPSDQDPSAEKETSADKEAASGKDASAEKEDTADKDVSAEKDAAADKEKSAEKDAAADKEAEKEDAADKDTSAEKDADTAKETAAEKDAAADEEEEPAAAEKKLTGEDLDELIEDVRQRVRQLLMKEGVGLTVQNNQVVEEYPVDVIGGNIVQVRTRAQSEDQRSSQAQRILSALHKLFPKVELTSERTLELSKDPVQEVREIIRRRVDKLGLAEPIIQRQGRDRIIVELPGIDDPEAAVTMLGTTALLEFRKVPEAYRPDVKRGPEGRESTTFQDKDGNDVPTDVVFHEGEPVILGTDLKSGSAVVGFEYGKPTVNLALTDEGSRKFDAFAKKNYHKYLAIYLDQECISAPRMEARHFGGRVQISGGFQSIEEANDLKILLNAGSLPVPVDVVEQRTVSATLGEDSVKRSFLSGLCGLLAVALIMIAFYRLPGVIAVGALLIYSLLVMAAMSALHATLTLPGIFGFILSIGMAVDANVIIFERLKEELRSGKTLRSAIQAGFERAWVAVLDGHVTTILIAIVLYLMGTGPIKGFAVTLFLGNVIDLFSAVTVTRLFMNLAANTRLGNRREMYGV